MVIFGRGIISVLLHMSLVLLWVVTGVTSENPQGPTQILSFAFEKRIASKGQWESTTDIQKQDRIRLMCVLDEEQISEFKIRKLNDDTALEHLEYPSKRQIVYEIRSLGCGNNGSYVCEGGNGINRTLNLDIYDCVPKVLSFTFEKWDPIEKQWTSTTDIERGKDIRLTCTIAGSTSYEFSLKKMGALTALSPIERPNSQQIIHVFRDLQCEQAGEYVCENERGVSRPLDIAISGCSSDILSFTFEEWDLEQEVWRTSTDIEKGEDIRLTCIISGPFSEKFSIKKLDDDDTGNLSFSEYPNNRQITYEIKSASCDDLGAYICDDGGEIRRTELGIFGCAPRFCTQDVISGEIAAMSMGEARTFNLCVIAFPDIGVTMASETSESKDWNIHVEPYPEIFSAFTISVLKTISSRDDFGKHIVSISTTHKGQQEVLEYTINVLQSHDSLQCPRDLKIDDLAPDSLTLSWKPGRAEIGFVQEFDVLMRKDAENWVSYGEKTQKTSILITGLQEETQYTFRVMPVDSGIEETNEDECMNALIVNTTKRSASDSSGSKSIVFLAVLVGISSSCGVCFVVIVVVYVIRRHSRQRHQINFPSDRTSQEEEKLNDDCL